MKNIRALVVVMALLAGCQHRDAQSRTGAPAVATSLRGVYSVNGELHINTFGAREGRPITRGHQDMKPSWSKTGGKIVFFRVTKFAPKVSNWKTAICVVNTDGTGFRKVTDGSLTDYNPTWTRDGKNTIIFSRYNDSRKQCIIHRTTADAKPGDEVVISDRAYSEYALSSLKDGRIFISSGREAGKLPYYLLTPKKGGGTYEHISFGFRVEGPLERVTVSPSETKITYEYQRGWEGWKYTGKTLYIADFDARTPAVTRPRLIANEALDRDLTYLYPRWTKDESAVVYHCDKTGKKQLYMYRLRDRSTTRVSTDARAVYMFPCGEESPK